MMDRCRTVATLAFLLSPACVPVWDDLPPEDAGSPAADGTPGEEGCSESRCPPPMWRCDRDDCVVNLCRSDNDCSGGPASSSGSGEAAGAPGYSCHREGDGPGLCTRECRRDADCGPGGFCYDPIGDAPAICLPKGGIPVDESCTPPGSPETLVRMDRSEICASLACPGGTCRPACVPGGVGREGTLLAEECRDDEDEICTLPTESFVPACSPPGPNQTGSDDCQYGYECEGGLCVEGTCTRLCTAHPQCVRYGLVCRKPKDSEDDAKFCLKAL